MMFEEFQRDLYRNFIEKDRWLMLLRGLCATLEITVVALVIGVVIGVVVAAVRSTYDKDGPDMKRRGRRITGRGTMSWRSPTCSAGST